MSDTVEIDANESESSYIITERDFVSMMIEMYRNRPVLWKVKHPHYCDRRVRADAVQEIVQELRQYKEDFDENELKRRINVLRTNFNKARSKQRPATLWYYNEMLFLTEQDTYEDHQSDTVVETIIADNSVDEEQNGNEDDETSDLEEKYRPNLMTASAHRIKKPKLVPRSLKNISSTPVKKVSTAPSTSKTFKNIEVKRKTVTEEQEDEETTDEVRSKDTDLEQYMTITTTYYKRPKSKENILAESWALKLKKLSPTQKMYAEKIINDVLFEAEIGNLTKNGVSFCPNF